MSDRSYKIAIALAVAVVTSKLAIVAASRNLWREFVVSEFQVLAAALVLWFLLKRPTRRNEL